ncbi:MAG: hypothetical protein Q8761_03280, partial [Sweet potato little leaf phytoplasma]|nr:hypothetical protein [Sweet potato little leaf phytoplasma]
LEMGAQRRATLEKEARLGDAENSSRIGESSRQGETKKGNASAPPTNPISSCREKTFCDLQCKEERFQDG